MWDKTHMSQNLRDQIRHRMNSQGLNAKRLSVEAGLNPTAVRDILDERVQNPTYRTIQALASRLGATAEELMQPLAAQSLPSPPPATSTGDIVPNVRLAPNAPPLDDFARMPRDVPVLGTAQAGDSDAFAIAFGSDPIDFVRRTPALTGVKNVFAIFVRGESMVPWREPGGIVYVHETRVPRPGDHVVAVLHRAEDQDHKFNAILKKLLRRDDSTVELLQYNPPGTEPIKLKASEIERLYRVLEWEEVIGL